MFLFYVLNFFKKGDIIQGGYNSGEDIIKGNTVCTFGKLTVNKQGCFGHGQAW